MVPNGWRKKNLEALFSFKNGVNASKEQYGEGYKFVNLMDIFKNPILKAENILGSVNITKEQFNNYQLKYGDILFNRTSETDDEIAYSSVYLDDAPAVFGGFVIKGSPLTQELDPKYSIYAFLANYFRSQVIRLGQGAVRANIGQKDLNKTYLLLPPIQEQQKIAEILSTWDKAIASTEKLITNSEQQKKALMQQLLTGKKRLLDENGVRFSGEWKRTQLKTFLTESTLRNKNSNIKRVLSITNHSGFILPEEQFSKRVASNNVENYKVVKNGQFGYNPSRLNVGSFGRLDQYKDGILSPMYVIFNVDASKVHSDYFLFWMGSGEANQRIKNSTQGSVRESVGFDALCAIPFSLPSTSEQEKIAQVLSNADREIELLKAKLEHLQREKKALMQQLLTGKRRVKGG